MSFAGNAVVTKVSDGLARITGVSLSSGATGTISLFEGAGQIKLPDSLNWNPYGGQDAGDGVVDLEEACQVSYVFVEDPGESIEVSYRMAITKANGLDPAAFLITFENFDTSEGGGAEMEIYVRFH